MKFNELTNQATRAFHRAGFKLKKHGPEILVVTGVVGTVVGAVICAISIPVWKKKFGA